MPSACARFVSASARASSTSPPPPLPSFGLFQRRTRIQFTPWFFMIWSSSICVPSVSKNFAPTDSICGSIETSAPMMKSSRSPGIGLTCTAAKAVGAETHGMTGSAAGSGSAGASDRSPAPSEARTSFLRLRLFMIFLPYSFQTL